MFYRTSRSCAFRLDRVLAVCPVNEESIPVEDSEPWLAYLEGCELPVRLDRREALEVVELLEQRFGVV